MHGMFAKLLAFLRAHWAVALPAFVYLYVFPYLPELRSPNELCRLHQARALVDYATFEINEVLRTKGWVGDLSCVAIARDSAGQVIERQACPLGHGQARFQEQHYFPSKAPLLSVAAAPVYAALKLLRGDKGVPEVPLVFFARLFCTLLPAVLLLIPLRRFLRAYVRVPVADALTAVYALGTLAFSYSELFMSHQTTGVLLFLCFFALWRAGRGEWPRWTYLVSGALAGLTVAAEYTAAPALVVLAIYGLWTAPGAAKGKASAAGLAILGVLPLAVAMMAYHQVAYGHPLHSGYKYLNDAAYMSWHQGGFLGIKLPDLRALTLSFFSPLRGLFALSPFLALALPGFAPRFWRTESRRELAAALAIFAIYTYFTSSFSYDSWGWTTGPRHLTPLVPFLMLPAALFVDWGLERFPAGVFAPGLAALSVLATSVMTFLNYIPDSLTNALYQVALPFALKGYLPQTWLSLAGVPNPWAALPAVFAVVAVAILVARALLPAARRWTSLAVSLGLVVAIVGIHASVKPEDDHGKRRDEGTYGFLEQRYLPRPGQASPPLWGP